MNEFAELRDSLMAMASIPSFAWQDSVLLESLSTEQRSWLESVAERHEHAPGDVIVREGDPADRFFVVGSGRVEVYRERAGRDLAFARMGAGEYFGVMALVDAHARVASVRALERGTTVSFSPSRMHAADPASAERVMHAVLVRHAREQNRRLRETGHIATGALRRELEKTEALVRLSVMMIVVITVVWAYVIAAQSLAAVPHLRGLTTLGIAILLGGGGLYIIRRNPYTLAFYGLTLAGWPAAVRAAVGWSAVVVAGLTALKWLAVSTVPAWSGLPVIHVRGLDSPSPGLMLTAAVLLYIPVCILQELAARGIMHASFAVLLPGPRGPRWALVLSNAVFSMFHVHYSVPMALGTFGLGLYLGLLWIRRKSLPGVIVAHYIVGFWAIEILDVLPLLGMNV